MLLSVGPEAGSAGSEAGSAGPEADPAAGTRLGPQVVGTRLGPQREPTALAELASALITAGGAGAIAGSVEPVPVAATAAAVDQAMSALDDRRLVIEADLAGLQLVLGRLLRRGLLDSVQTAVLTRKPIDYLTRLGHPSSPAAQVEVAMRGRPRLVGVIKDDSGGLCVDAAIVRPWLGEPAWWLRAVVDDQRLCDGAASSVSLRRIGPAELEATVRLARPGLRRQRKLRGRSLQLACDEAAIEQDGIVRERSRTKRTFWSEPELWRLNL